MFSKVLEKVNKMKFKYVYILLFLIIFIVIYMLPYLFIAVPKTIELANIKNESEFFVTLPRGEGFEPWIAVENCTPFEINIKIIDDRNQVIYSTDLNSSSKQLSRLGDLSSKYKNKDFCKFLVVQDGRKKWDLFKYGKRYTFKVYIKKLLKKTNVYLNMDYLSIWFPRNEVD